MTDRTSTATHHRTPTEAVEAQVLDAAERLVVAAGPEALSMRGLATEAGVAPMSIYNRFGDKAGVLRALLVRGFRELRAATEPPRSPAGVRSADEAVDRLLTSGRAYRTFAKKHPGTYALMFGGRITIEDDDETLTAATASFETLVGLVADAQVAGALVGGNPVELAQRIWATIHGAVSLELDAVCFADDTDAHYDALLDTVLLGLAPDTGTPGLP